MKCDKKKKELIVKNCLFIGSAVSSLWADRAACLCRLVTFPSLPVSNRLLSRHCQTIWSSSSNKAVGKLTFCFVFFNWHLFRCYIFLKILFFYHISIKQNKISICKITIYGTVSTFWSGKIMFPLLTSYRSSPEPVCLFYRNVASMLPVMFLIHLSSVN